MPINCPLGGRILKPKPFHHVTYLTQQTRRIRLFPYCFALLLLGYCGCSPSPEPNDDSQEVAAVVSSGSEEASIPIVELTTAVVDRLPLRRQATGQLRARREVVIKSQAGGELLEAPEEGHYYRRGATLLSIDPQPLRLARDRSRAARDEADFRRRDLLLRLSTNLPEGDTSITELARTNILIQSGLPAAEAALAEAEFRLRQAQQAAPFAGRAADVVVQTGQQIAPGEVVCTLTDLGSLEAEFMLLEQELGSLKEGRQVFVSPVARPELALPAKLDIINPRVDEGGLLRVRARLTGTAGATLYPGMNVTVTLEGRAAEAVVVPKAAVVLRGGRPLVFAYDEGTERVAWQYVTVVAENDEAVAISEGVMAGQRVVVGGNFSLDHDSVVRVAK